MIFFRKYEPGDIWEVMTKDILTELGYGIDEKYINSDYTWTLVDDLRVLGCAGFRQYWNGVFEAWLHPRSKEVMQKYKLMIVRKIKQEMKNLPAHRIQANIAANLEKNIKFMQIVGLYFECRLHKYGPMKEDYVIHSLVR